jgi:beta-galactosidase/beta-glucuronidase
MIRPEHPRPQFVRDQWRNLNGTWQFEMDLDRNGRERGLVNAERLGDEIAVPFCPESRLSGIGHTDFIPAVWYRRPFSVPETWWGKRILLHFGAVDYDCWAYVNGQEVGFHRGGYAPFTFEVTDALRAGENVLVVYAEDDTSSPLQPSGKQSPRAESFGCFYTRTTGIWQTVWLEAVPPAYLLRPKLTPDLEAGQVHVQVQVDGPSEGLALRARAMVEGAPVGASENPIRGGWAWLTLDLDVVRTWAPGDPFLYDLELVLVDGDRPVDRLECYFGLRSLAVRGPALLLNGQPLLQRLVLDQGFYPDGIYTAPSDDALRADIEASLAMGFNGARLHQKVFEERFLYWADRLGYLVWDEYPNWGLDLSRPEALERCLPEWLSVLERDHSHPSVVGWCPFNETQRDQNREIVRTVYRVTKQLDPTRPVVDTSGYVHVETDLFDVHDYDQDPEAFAARYAPLAEGGAAFVRFPDQSAPYAGQPYWVSEYGGIWWNPGQTNDSAWGYGERPGSREEFLSRYEALTEALLAHPKMCAFCYTQLYDIEQEVNGLYTYDRHAKFDAELIREINAGPAAVERQKSEL